MIELKHLTIRAGSFLLQDVSFAVNAGEYAVLMGRTGAGKTTLLETLCGLRGSTRGQVRLGGRDVTTVSPAQRGVGYVPQDLALFPTMTVEEHLSFALRLRRFQPSDRRQRVHQLACMLEIEHLLSRRVTKLSGGESQRVALGRALSFRPEVLLLDEPLSALDEPTREKMQSLLREVQRTTGVTTLHVTHSREEARALADRVFVLENGKVTPASSDG